MWIVYSVKIDNKFYIGVTSKGLDWRKRRHQVEARRGLTATVFHNKLAKNIDIAEWSILVDNITKEEALNLEKLYIKQYSSKFPDGYNLTDGGEGVWNHAHSEETKQKIKKANTGRKHSIESKQLMSKNRTGVCPGKQSKKARDSKAISCGTKPFEVFTKDGVCIGFWINKSDCARDLKISRDTVIRGLKNKSPNYNVKYIFKVKE